MGKALPASAIERYRRDGYHCPVRVLSLEQAREYRARLEALEREQGGPLTGSQRVTPYLLRAWLNDLVRLPAILDAVGDVLGPDSLCCHDTAPGSGLDS